MTKQIVVSGIFYVQTVVEPGPAGARGMLPFPAGEYEAGTSYTATTNVAPYVLLSGIYYVMNKVGTWLGTSIGKTPAQDYATNGVNAMWIPFENYKAIYVELLMANLGLIGQAVFYDEFMFSQKGTDSDGNPSTNYQGFADGTFKPNLLLNFLTGQLKCKNSELEGQITATSGVFNGYLKMPFIEKHSGSSMYLDLNEGSYYSIFGDNNSSVYLPDPDPFIGSSVIVNNPIPGTRVDISFTLKINSQNNNYFFYNGFNPFSDKKIIGIKASALMIKLIAVKVGDFRYWHIENFNEIKSDRLLY